MATAAVLPPPSPPAMHTLPHTLAVNAGTLPRPRLGWLRPTPLSTPLAEMRTRLQEDGYLFVKSLLPREDVLRMRAHYFSQYAGTSLLDPGKPVGDGVFNPAEEAVKHGGIGGAEPTGAEMDALRAAHVTDDYVAFVNHPVLRGMVRELMRWEGEAMLRRTMLRHNVPGAMSTGVHYDRLFLRGGEGFFLTAWVPIGDVDVDGGGLVYLEDGVGWGERIEEDFWARAEAKGWGMEEKVSAFNSQMSWNGILAEEPGGFEGAFGHLDGHLDTDDGGKERGEGGGRKWLVAEYEAGDVVFHHPCAVHSSSLNTDAEGRIRLSTDLRFYSKKDFEEGRADERWMKIWGPGDGL